MEKLSMGTTLLAVQCVDGVVVASDSRSSAGSFVADPISNKITQVGSFNLFLARSGTTADTQALGRFVKYYLNVLSIDSDNPNHKFVSTAAQILRKLITANKGRLEAAIIVAGCDEVDGPSIYQVSLSGMAVKRKFATSGSGSSYIMAQCDSEYRDNFTVEEGTQFAIRSVTSAITRDGSSGGLVNVVQIRPDGSKRIIVRPNQQPFNQSIVKT